MRKRDTSVRRLRGQLVFVEFERKAIRVDCLLGPSWDEPGQPASFQVKLPPAGRSPVPAHTMLRQWVADGVPIEVTVTNERRGAVVNFSAPSGRIVFEPFESADA